MQVQCVHCGKRYSLRDENAGSQFACRSCGGMSPIQPAPIQEARPATASPAPLETALIAATCTSCGKQYRLKPSAEGMKFKCKQCGALSPVEATSAPPAMIAKPAQPLSARPVRPPMSREQGPMPAAKLVKNSGRAASPSEPLMAALVEPQPAVPVQTSSPASANMLDLLNEAGGPAPAPPFAVPLPPARPAPPKPQPATRKKKRKSVAAREAAQETMSRVFGGIICMVIGVGVTALGVYGMQNGARRAWRTTFVGIGIIVLGFLVTIGRYNAD